MMVLFVCGKPYNSSVSVSGWTQLGSAFTDGTTAAGNDSGSTFMTAFYKEAASDTETDPTVTEGATTWNVVGAIVMVFSKDSGDTWETPVIAGGGNGTSAAVLTVTCGSNPGITTGDHVISSIVCRSDNGTPSQDFDTAATGVTFTETKDPATDPETTTGGDMSFVMSRSTVSGTASAAPTITVDWAASNANPGTGALVRLRVSSGTDLEPAGLDHGRAQGTPVTSPQILHSALSRTRAQGTPGVSPTLTTAALERTRALGDPTVSIVTTLTTESLVRTRAQGTPVVNPSVVMAGLARSRALGTTIIDNDVQPFSITRTRALGTPTLNPQVVMAALERTRELGAPNMQGEAGVLFERAKTGVGV